MPSDAVDGKGLILDTIVRWSTNAGRGEKADLARHLGWTPQKLTNALAKARAGTVSPTVLQLYQAIAADRKTRDVLDPLVVGSHVPVRLDDLALFVATRYGVGFDTACRYLRDRFPTIRNLFDPYEYVFATVKEGAP